MSDQPVDISELTTRPPHRRAEIAYAAASLALALVLAALWPLQTSWVAGQPLVRQPGLWPLIAVAGMLIFGAGEAVFAWRRYRAGEGRIWPELALWLQSAEFLAWFMAYVLATPWIGYLAATMIFTTLLAFRLGYRGRLLAFTPLLGAGIVILFKAFLAVRVPGGAVYDLFPQALRNVLVLYL